MMEVYAWMRLLCNDPGACWDFKAATVLLTLEILFAKNVEKD